MPLLAAAGLLAAGRPAHAAWPASPGAGLETYPATLTVALPAPRLRAGEVVELTCAGLPERVEEMEILLSLDDGRTWPLRLGRCLEPHRGRFRWRVPNLPSVAARLRARYGTARGEWEGEPSARFRILGDPGLRPERIGFHEDLAWQGAAPAEIPAPSGSLAAPEGGTAEGSGCPASTPPRDAFAVPVKSRLPHATALPPGFTPAALAARSLPPRSVPLRN